MHHAQNHGQGVHVSFFSKLVRRSDYFWLVFLICWGFSFRVDRVFFMYLLFEFFFNWLLLAGVRKYLRNHCPLAANFGTKACRFAVGVWFCIGESSCWGGGYYVYFSCQTLFFSVIEIFLALQNWLIPSSCCWWRWPLCCIFTYFNLGWKIN